MRIRYLKPDFFKDEDIKNLPFEVRLFFQGLWCFADKQGKMEDRPERLKVEIMPYDEIDINKCLEILSNKPFINRYEIDGHRYIKIINWHKHQKPHHTEKDSVIPEPITVTVSDTVKQQGIGNGESKGKGKGNGELVMGNLKQLGASAELTNGDITVNTPLDNIRDIVNHYKTITGNDINDKAWDKTHFPRNTKAARELLEYLGEVEKAKTCITDVKKWAEENGLSWKLETVVTKSADWKNNNLKITGGSNGRKQKSTTIEYDSSKYDNISK